MAGFYTNVTLKNVAQEEAVEFLRQTGRAAYVSPTVDGLTVVYELECEEQDPEVLAELASKLSLYFGCPALAVSNRDDYFLSYYLYKAGKLVDEYDSRPEDPDPMAMQLRPRKGGDAQKLCAVMGSESPATEVDSILQGVYALAVDRHTELARALGLPSWSVGTGYYSLEDGRADLPQDTRQSLFRHTGP